MRATSGRSCVVRRYLPGASLRPPPRRQPARRQSGIALVLVLWAGALLGVIATSFAFSVRTDNALVVNAGSRLQAGALAESAVNRALLGLLEGDASLRWRADGRVYEMQFEGGILRASVRAETGKIDLNAAPRPLLEGLLAAAQDGLDEALVDPVALAAAILDWRDADGRARPLGAEDPDYRAAGRKHGAGDRAFLSIDELDQVLGMPSELVTRLRPALTVHTRSPQIDPLTAPRLALLAIPTLDPARVEAFLEARDRHFEAGEEATGERAQLPMHLLAGGERYLSRARARVYTVLAEGRTSDGVAAYRQAVVRTSSSPRRPYLLLAWADEPIPVERPSAGSPPQE